MSRVLLACTIASLTFTGGSLGLNQPLQASITTFSLGSDSDFVSFRDSNGFTKRFGGNVRWGNAATNGDWELAVVDGGDVPIDAAKQIGWSTSTSNSHGVSFSYNSSSDTASLTADFGNSGQIEALNRSVAGSPALNTLLIRVRDGSAGFTKLQDVQITFTDDGSQHDLTSPLLGDADANYIGIVSTRLGGGFELTANGEMIAGGTLKGSDPAYQFKVGYTDNPSTFGDPVPEPATCVMWLAGLVGLVFGWHRRRQRLASV